MKQMLPIGIGLIVVGALLALFNSGDTPYPTYTLIAGVALVAVYVLANLREMGKRSTMYGLNALLMSGFMVAILVVIYLIAQNRDKTWDFSATGKYTLDPQTASILDGLETPVELLVFYPTPIRTGREFELIKTLLDQYATRSAKLTYKVLDPSKDYDTAMEYRTLLNSSLEPTIIAEVKAEGTPFREKAKGTKQEDISNAIKKVTHRTAVNAYFLVGHYEKELESENPAGLALLKQFLEEENFTVSTLRLPATGDIPEEAEILALVGPEEDLSEVEREALRRFVLRGGGLFVALDPGMCPATASWLTDFGVQAGDNTIIQMEVGAGSLEDLLTGRMTARPSRNVSVEKFHERHEITKDLGNSSVTLIRARSIGNVPSPPDGIMPTQLAETAGGMLGNTNLPNSWAESNPEALDSGTATVDTLYDSKVDKAGPVALAQAVEIDLDRVNDGKPDPANPSKKGKVVVIGDSDFLTVSGMSGRGGGVSRGAHDFALNMFNWLAGQVDLITIREAQMTDTSVILSASQKAMIRNLLVVVIPLFFFPAIGIAVGVYRWRRYV